MNKIKKFFTTKAGKITLVILLLGLGFISGMEYKAYQVRSAISGAFEDFSFGEVSETKQDNTKTIASNDLNKKVNLSVEKKGFITQSYADYNTFTFKFENNTDKDIEGVQGTINFMDLFGNSIQQIRLSYDKGILAGESKLYDATVDYNPFIDTDIKLKNIELSKMKYEWDVNTIIYSVGSQESK